MDLGMHNSGYQHLEESYDGRQYGDVGLELIETPESRAPSYLSSSKKSFVNDDDEASLVTHAPAPAGFDLRDGDKTAFELVNNVSDTGFVREKSGKRQGWHFGVLVCALTASSVLFMNVVLTITAVANFDTNNGIGTAYEGSCDVTNSMTFWLHILINALSTILLSASNYTMQALSAPTRQEVDRAHARGDWMDIGVASVRNLSRIRWHRVGLWWMLAVSSIPIHLLYNSAVFKTIESNAYLSIVANPVWYENPGNFSTNITYDGTSDPIPMYLDGGGEIKPLTTIQKFFHDSLNDTAKVKNLTNTECIQTYSASFLSGSSDVIAVTNEPGTSVNETMFYVEWGGSVSEDGYGTNYDWLCLYNFNATLEKCDPSKVKKNATQWTINGKRISYCLSETTPQQCTVQFSTVVLTAVIICNVLKSTAMFITLYWQKDVTLVTIGDAIASYLDRPDEVTKGRCLMSRHDIKTWHLAGAKETPNTDPLPKTYFEQQAMSRFFSAASWKRWGVTFGLIAGGITSSIGLLAMGAYYLRGYGTDPFSIGFGTISSQALVGTQLPQAGSAGLVSAVLLANTPQAVVSFLYLLYNSLMTSLLLAKEWSTYALRRKPLRVTTRFGQQRSTYYLQLPFRYSGPLLVISATLHWVISQSLFLARIKTLTEGNEEDSGNISQVGYSCPPILTAILIGVVLIIAAVVMGFRRFNSPIPVASSCSVAIAAACHRPKDDINAAYLPVQWGEVEVDDRKDEIGHCCFTTFPVRSPASGRMYA